MTSVKPNNIDEYISSFPTPVQQTLELIRATIQKAEPKATETISYAIPTFVFKGNLVHFAAFKNHIGFYSTPDGHEEFEKELSGYKRGKGSVQFPLNKPLPLDLIMRIVRYRVKQNLERASEK